jgi:hypothetical protein
MEQVRGRKQHMHRLVVCDILMLNTIYSAKLCPKDVRGVTSASNYCDYHTAIDTSISPCQAFQSADQRIMNAL